MQTVRGQQWGNRNGKSAKNATTNQTYKHSIPSLSKLRQGQNYKHSQDRYRRSTSRHDDQTSSASSVDQAQKETNGLVTYLIDFRSAMANQILFFVYKTMQNTLIPLRGSVGYQE